MTKALEVTQLLQEWGRGDVSARDRLMPLVYAELRRQAAAYLRRERRGHTLQPTALVNEAHLKLVNQDRAGWKNRAQFFAVTACVMRRILVDHARAIRMAKRSGRLLCVTLDEEHHARVNPRGIDVLALDEALSRLSVFDPRKSAVAELRFFSGLSSEETAHVLGVSLATVERDWQAARAWSVRGTEMSERNAPMTPERWQEIQDVFHAVLACSDERRAAFLAEACRDDGSLRAEVEVLIAAHHEAGSFGDQPLVNLKSTPGRCSHCGCDIVTDAGLSGLCPQCLLRLALGERNPALEPLAPGNVFGARYQVLKVLGRGGMGEVVHAFDLKLRVDVALKAVSADRAGSDQARELLRREVRAAREVISSNVCRIFDLIVADGEELVSMEYIDGATLSDTLRQRGPLTLQETQEIASQFLAGLEAIHRAGLVHRDIKPENVMITRAGRVVIMDFGLANVPDGYSADGGHPWIHAARAAARRPPRRQSGCVCGWSGTHRNVDSWRARQRRGASVALARDSSRPAATARRPMEFVLSRAVAANPAARYASAHDLARALEEVTLRLPGFEQRHPYPGLAAFTSDNAEYFFGREVETEQVWKKLERPRLLALIGPSGAGKSSFLRAGLLQTLPGSWKAIFATPGNRPFQSLARALAPAMAGDPAAVEQLLRFEEEDAALSLFIGLRRQQHVLLVIDQFEELFTLNPPDVQASFASLLARLVVDADLRVIVSLRDDFLLRCQEHEGLHAVFSDLTPLGTLTQSALRRAFVQPALACGYRFEDEALVDEMVGEVSDERGALPLLAFAASRLWEQRDRDRGLLTREAYREIGGVAGALAQHAERTLERIGRNRTLIVRELFRNLVTSQGTRAVREREELLSVFDRGHAGIGSRKEAEEVLAALVDARLLTSYERVGESGTSHRQVEIVHESLLAAWPQLVHWQAQDAEGAQIRDQLRQASQALA